MSSRAKLAGALGVAELLDADLRKPLPSPKRDHVQSPAAGYKASAVSSPFAGQGFAAPLEPEPPKSFRVCNGAHAADEMSWSADQKASPSTAPRDNRQSVAPDGATSKDHGPKALLPALESNLEANKPESAGYPCAQCVASPPSVAPSSVQNSAIPPAFAPQGLAVPSAHCKISEGGASEIRTKVFRIGAPLLRSTIPVSIGGRRDSKNMKSVQRPVENGDGSDVETILSLSEEECAEEGQLSVTLDFPC